MATLVLTAACTRDTNPAASLVQRSYNIQALIDTRSACPFPDELVGWRRRGDPAPVIPSAPDVVRLLITTIAPGSWGDPDRYPTDSIRHETLLVVDPANAPNPPDDSAGQSVIRTQHDQLLVTATPAVHDQIATQLDLLRQQRREPVYLNVHWVRLNPASIAAEPIAQRFRAYTHATPARTLDSSRNAFVSPDGVSLLRQCETDAAGTVTSAQLTLGSGQTCTLDRPTETGWHDLGMEICATATSDLKYVTLRVAVERPDATGTPQRMQVTVTVPDGGSLLLQPAEPDLALIVVPSLVIFCEPDPSPEHGAEKGPAR